MELMLLMRYCTSNIAAFSFEAMCEHTFQHATRLVQKQKQVISENEAKVYQNAWAWRGFS
jgi:hypothetical protein